MTNARSPYEIVLGDVLEGLHPRLMAYFSAIPAGSVGRGEGVFDVVGTPRRWLWPVLRLLGRQGVVFAGRHRDVPFTVENRAVVDASGRVAVEAVRTFHFARARAARSGARDRRMVDAITADAAGLVDHLGTRRQWSAALTPEVVGGELHLTSTAMTVAWGPRSVPIPAAVSPRVRLIERFDDHADRQHVSITLDVPLVGRVYEYAGSFTYDVVSDDPAARPIDVNPPATTRPAATRPTTGADT